jgi:hypothetical protein
MTDSTSSKRPDRPAHRPSWGRALLLSTAVALGLVAVPAVAQASSRPKPPSPLYCSKVSAVSVSAIMGYRLPAGSPFTDHLKATKKNDGISAVVSSCTFGAETSLASLAKDVILSFEVTSRPITGAELKKAFSQAETLKFKFTPYSGLGMTAFYYTFREGGITVQGMAGMDGTKIYSAGIYIKTPARSKLAALVRLAEEL